MNKQWITIICLLAIIILGGLGGWQYINELKEEKEYTYSGAATPIATAPERQCVSQHIYNAINGMEITADEFARYLKGDNITLEGFVGINEGFVRYSSKLNDATPVTTEDREYKRQAWAIAERMAADTYYILDYIGTGNGSQTESAQKMLRLSTYDVEFASVRKQIKACENGI